MAFDRAIAEDVLKIKYLPTIRDQIDLSTPYLSELEKNTEDVSGLFAHMALHVGRSEAVGNRDGEHDAIPAARAQDYSKARFHVRVITGTISITKALIETSKTDEAAYLRAEQSEVERMTEQVKEELGRQVVSNDDDGTAAPPNISLGVGGASGVLARCGTTTDSTTVVLANTNVVTFRRLRAGMPIDIINTDTDAALVEGRTVVSVNRTAGTFVISGASVTTTADHAIVRAGNYGKECRGIMSVVGAGSLQGVPDHDEWRASRLVNGGTPRPYSEMLIQELLDDIHANSGTRPDALLCEYTQQRNVYAEMKSMKRAVNTLELKGGHTALAFNDNIPVMVDKYCDPTVIVGFNRKHQALYQTTDWAWDDTDGSVLKWTGGYKFVAFITKFCDLGVDRRNAFGVIGDLATSAEAA